MPSAFDQVFAAYKRRLFGLSCLRMCRSRDFAEILLQDVPAPAQHVEYIQRYERGLARCCRSCKCGDFNSLLDQKHGMPRAADWARAYVVMARML